MSNDLEKYIQSKVQKALEGSFTEAQIYGVGYIKISVNENNLEVEHIPLSEVESEFENFKLLKPFILPTSEN